MPVVVAGLGGEAAAEPGDGALDPHGHTGEQEEEKGEVGGAGNGLAGGGVFTKPTVPKRDLAEEFAGGCGGLPREAAGVRIDVDEFVAREGELGGGVRTVDQGEGGGFGGGAEDLVYWQPSCARGDGDRVDGPVSPREKLFFIGEKDPGDAHQKDNEASEDAGDEVGPEEETTHD